MFAIQTIDVVNILHQFNCNDQVAETNLVSHYQINDKIIMIVMATTTANKYILKFYSDKVVDMELENLQCRFSEFQFLSGVSLPHKYTANGKYVVKAIIDNIPFLVTVEDVFGIDVTIITEETAFELGNVLGQMHKFSVLADYHLPKGIAYNTLYSQKVEYDAIWESVAVEHLSNNLIQDTRFIHNRNVTTLRSMWKELPTYAVHGDLGLTSNFMYDETYGYGVIDFNLSGDEILIGDLLITWYSSRYSKPFVNSISSTEAKNIRDAFYKGYSVNRRLERYEASIFQSSAKIVNGLYFSRYVANLFKTHEEESGKKLYSKIVESFDSIDTSIDCD